MDIKTVGVDPSFPIQTRDGREARIYETLPNGNIAAFIQKHLHSNEWVFKIFYKDGRTCSHYRLQELACGDDLVNISKKKIRKEGWINIYSTGCSQIMARQSGIYKYKADVEEKARLLKLAFGPSPIATIKIEWEEEQ